MDYKSSIDLHDILVSELLEKKALSALILLIDFGRELDFSYNKNNYFISKDKSKSYVSIWCKNTEQSFERVELLIENAYIEKEKFIDIWEKLEIVTLF